MTTATLCEMVEVDGKPGYQWCPNCGRVRGYPQGQKRPSPLPENYRRVCVAPKPAKEKSDQPDQPRPSRLRTYLTAREKWVAAGKPLRSDSERLALLEICQACEHYDPKPVVPGLSGGRCKVCGCGLARERDTLNKIAWATEECPRGKWPDLTLNPATP